MNLKLLALLATLLALPFYTLAQTDIDSLSARKWYAPDGVTLQFAGNIGMFAAGPNYSFLKDKVNAELLYGIVPKLDGNEVLHLLTAKAIYKPFRKIAFRNNFTITPLHTSLALSYHFRDQFSTSWDSAYPKNYYWWTSSLRITGALGTAITHPLPAGSTFKDLSLYGEVGTYDLIVTSAVKDRTLTIGDILSFAIGIRAGL